MSAPYIPATALGGDLITGWSGPAEKICVSGWLQVAVIGTPPRDVPGSTVDYAIVNAADDYPSGRTSYRRIRLDPRREEVAHHIADVLRRKGHEVGHLLPVALGGRQGDVIALAEPTCTHPGCDEAAGHGGVHQMGNTRQIVTIPAADVSAVLLAASVAGVEAGRGVVRGVLGEWHTLGHAWGRSNEFVLVYNEPRGWQRGWRIGYVGQIIEQGPETGPEGRAAADAALLRLGYAYLSPAAPFGVVVPTFDLENER